MVDAQLQQTGTLAVGLIQVVSAGQIHDLAQRSLTWSHHAFITISTLVPGLQQPELLTFTLWFLTASFMALGTRSFSRPLYLTGLLACMLHVISVVYPVPPLLDFVWFPWLGLELIRAPSPARNAGTQRSLATSAIAATGDLLQGVVHSLLTREKRDWFDPREEEAFHQDRELEMSRWATFDRLL